MNPSDLPFSAHAADQATLLAAVRRLDNVQIMEHVAMVDLLVDGGFCCW